MSGRMILFIAAPMTAFVHCPRTNCGKGLIIPHAEHSRMVQPRMSDEQSPAQAEFDRCNRCTDRPVHLAQRSRFSFVPTMGRSQLGSDPWRLQ